jgi:Bifunctional DNA primase/polymerase, N-terminal/Primase C terminal 1 (PriCT-1)
MPLLRPDDHRSNELLAEAGRIAVQLRLAIAWTSGIRGEKAKQARDTGAGAWKKAAPLPDPEFAAALFVGRCRTRNPVVVASRSGLVLVESDGEEDELLARHGIPPLPVTVSVRSRRGVHRYFRPPEGGAPLKIQVGLEAVTVSEDGYLVTAPALHASGHVYAFNGNATMAALPAVTYARLVELGRQARENVKLGLEAGETIPEGLRADTLFHVALILAREGLEEQEVLPSILALNRRCDPPLEEEEVRSQVRGATKWARKRPDPAADLRRRAAELLAGLAEARGRP